jgi:hypothetical protein
MPKAAHFFSWQKNHTCFVSTKNLRYWYDVHTSVVSTGLIAGRILECALIDGVVLTDPAHPYALMDFVFFLLHTGEVVMVLGALSPWQHHSVTGAVN